MSESPRVLIVGGAGQLGIELQHSFAGTNPLVAVDREVVDLRIPDQIRAIVRSVKPDVIINSAAYTAVDRAEAEPEMAAAINARAPRILAEEALQTGALLVHYSTDYVFDGTKEQPWTESDQPHPVNTYGAGKLAGEEAIRQVGGRYLIFRTSWVYGPHGKNFLLTMLRLGRERDRLTVVDDQYGAPTTSIELARVTRAIVDGVLAGEYGSDQEWAGLYHATCAGSTTWCGFTRAIFARAAHLLDGRQPEVVGIPSSDYPTPAKRPRNSVMSNARLQERFGVQLAPWEAALDEVIARLASRGQKREGAPPRA
ncbi:MAG TPA: dTDP-4-dehydrorhamnose reductase [Acidobacteriaceae bacterium]|jgi:dTDP-4-dehydrorhamnose reductase|nr:dTDP-4-dehydrorhamnose reductase [Acidobacteriaceae bacterium]